MNFVTNDYKETEKIGGKLANRLNGDEVIAFYGDIGAGKTTFIRGIAKSFGLENMVSSPTFSILNEYYDKSEKKLKIYHFDMYRISGYEDLESTGFFDYLGKGIILIEWSENLDKEYLPSDVIKIMIRKCGEENKRIIDIEGIELE